MAEGYKFHLIYFWLPNADTAIARVADRVKRGGHHVPDDIIRRRYTRSIYNFFHLYQPVSTSWRVYNNGTEDGPALVALGSGRTAIRIADPGQWRAIQESATHGDQDAS